MRQQWSALLVLFVASVTGRGVLESGKEYVSEYTISVGSEDHGHEHKGFVLKMLLVGHKIAAGGVGLHLEEVQLLSENNEALPETPETTKLKEYLMVPFEYSRAEPLPLKIYAPETLESESVNIKRGLVNLWQYYDASNGKAYGTEIEGSSGKCRESFYASDENATAVNYNRFNSFQNCNGIFKHEEIKAQSMKNAYCSKGNNIIRTISYEYRMGLKTGDPFDIKSTERVKFDSSLPRGLFDDLVIRQHLKSVEVRDSNEVREHRGESISTTTEVNIPLLPTDKNQAEALSASIALLNRLIKNLNETSAITDLSDIKLPGDVLGLNYYMSQLDNKGTVKVFESSRSVDDKDLLFGQLSGLGGKSNLRPLYKDGCDSEVPSVGLDCISSETWKKWYKTLALFFDKVATQGPIQGYLDNGPVDSCTALLESLNTKNIDVEDKEAAAFYNSISTSCSAILYKYCANMGTARAVCAEGINSEVLVPLPADAGDHLIGYRINILKNLNAKEGIPFLSAIFEDRSKCIRLRSRAAWALYRIGMHRPKKIQAIAMKVLSDKEQGHEMRIPAFMMAVLDNNLSKLQTMAQYLIDNRETEDRDLVTFAFSYFQSLSKAKPDDCHKQYFDSAKFVFENMLEAHERTMGPKGLLGSWHRIFSFGDAQIRVGTIASHTDIVPRSLYISYTDPQQSRSIALAHFSKNFHLKMMVKLKKSIAANKAKNISGLNVSPFLFDDDDDSFPGYFSVNVNGLDAKFDTFKNFKELQMKFHENLFMFKEVAHFFNIFNTIKSTTHTESGLRVGFFTSQGAVNSVAKPLIIEYFDMSSTKGAQQTATIRVPRAQLQSTAFFTSYVRLPQTSFRFISGKKSDKAVNLPQIGLDVKMGEFASSGLKGQGKEIAIIPYFEIEQEDFTKPFDVYYRSLNKFVGTMAGVNPAELPLKPQKRTEVVNMQQHLAWGYRVEKTVGYERPSPRTSPLTRWSLRYQEVDSHTTPFTYRVSLTPHSNPNVEPRSRIMIVFAVGLEATGHLVKHMSVAVENKLKEFDAESHAFSDPLKIKLEKRILPSDIKTRRYDMRFESHPLTTFITSKWSAVSHGYPEVSWKDDNIAIEGSMSFEDDSHEEPGHGAHDSHGAHGDHGGHGAHSSPAHEDHESHGAHECLVFNGTLYRTEEQKRWSLGEDEEFVLKALLEDMDDPRDFKDTCYSLKRFLGMSLDMNILREPTEGVKRLYRKFRDTLVHSNYRYLSYDLNDKLDQNTIKVRMNSSMNTKFNDMSIQDKNGKQTFTHFPSQVLPLLTRSNCALKPSLLHDLMRPICALRVEGNHLVGGTFDGYLYKNRTLEQCTYRLASECKGKTFEIKYNKQDRSAEVTYRSSKVTLFSKKILVNGVEVTPKVGTLGMVEGPIIMGSIAMGAVFIKLPNQVTIGFMDGTSPDTDHLMVEASRLMKGSLCGLCGDMDGDPNNDIDPPQTCLSTEPCPRCVCPMNYLPVCGSDGVNYPNQCAFDCAEKCDPALSSNSGACPA